MRLGDTRFFNLFARLAAASNADRDCDDWQVGDVHWRRARHVHWGADASFQMELYTLACTRRPAWTLLLGHEMWWAGDRSKTIRNGRWIHISKGTRQDILRWFGEQEKALERS